MQSAHAYLQLLGLERPLHEGETPCPSCKGRGWFDEGEGPSSVYVDCESCAGGGTVIEDYDWISDDLRNQICNGMPGTLICEGKGG